LAEKEKRLSENQKEIEMLLEKNERKISHVQKPDHGNERRSSRPAPSKRKIDSDSDDPIEEEPNQAQSDSEEIILPPKRSL
jgi:hypothetical protein